jgi:hydroxymethylglutaryl-CoA lyase
MSREQSLVQIRDIAKIVGGRTALSVSLSTCFGCPFEGDVPIATVQSLVGQLVDIGFERVSLCDTTGMANPSLVVQLFDSVLTRWPSIEFTAHFHDTRGLGLANALTAFEAGIRRFDASLGGLGGCPYAPGATGNVCTEDLVHMFQAMSVETQVDLAELIRLSLELPEMVGHDVPGHVAKAGPSTRRYPMRAAAEGQ